MNLRASLPCIALLAFSSLLLAEDAEKKAETREVKIKDITLTIPADWKHTEPGGQFARLRLAQFQIPPAKGDEETVELVVSSFGGGGGGLQANLPRWVGEFEPKGREMKITTGKSKQGEYSVVTVSGSHVGPPFSRRTTPLADAKLIAISLVVPEKGTYYLKVSGPAKTIEGVADDLRKAIGANAKDEKEYDPNAE